MGGATGGTPVFDVELHQQLSSDRMNDIEAKLSKEMTRREKHFERFDAIRKFLLLVCDDKLFSVAVRGNSTVRSAVNDEVHLDNDYDDDTTVDSLNRVQEIVDKHQERLRKAKMAAELEGRKDPAERKGKGKGKGKVNNPVPNINIVENTDRLKSLIVNANDYFAHSDNEVEKHVDEHLTLLHRETTSPESDMSTLTTDLHILMSWLEGFMPVAPAAIEPNDAMNDDYE